MGILKSSLPLPHPHGSIDGQTKQVFMLPIVEAESKFINIFG